MTVSEWRASRQRRRAAVGLIAIAAVCIIALSLTARPSMASGRSDSTIRTAMVSKLTAMSLRGARRSGDMHPQWIKVVTTIRATALREAMHCGTVSGAASQQVYLVVMKGNFTFADAAPPHGRAPTGTYMTVTLDINTLQTDDIGLSNHPPFSPLSHLGHIYTLKVSN